MSHTARPTTRPARRTRFIAIVALAATGALALAGCASAAAESPSASSDADGVKTSFKIGGGTDNPLEVDVLAYIADEVAPDHGVDIEVVGLEDSRHLNEAVNAGELDGHVALHQPYLDSVLAEQPDWKLTTSIPVYISLISLASRKHSSLDDLPEGALVTLAEDPSNEAKSLTVLADEGLITLKEGTDPNIATIADVDENPKNLQFLPVAGPQLARSLDDSDLTVVQASYLRAAGIDQSVEIVTNEQDVKFAIALTTLVENADSDEFALLREVFEDPRIDDFVDENFGDIARGVRG